VSAVAVSLQGLFLGPIFPAAVVVARKLLPAHIYVSALGFAIALSGGGASILPFAIGALAQAKGVSVFQPVILAMLVIIFVLWICLPIIDESNKHQNENEGRWKGIDFDLIHTGRQTIVELRSRG